MGVAAEHIKQHCICLRSVQSLRFWYELHIEVYQLPRTLTVDLETLCHRLLYIGRYGIEQRNMYLLAAGKYPQRRRA